MFFVSIGLRSSASRRLKQNAEGRASQNSGQVWHVRSCDPWAGNDPTDIWVHSLSARALIYLVFSELARLSNVKKAFMWQASFAKPRKTITFGDAFEDVEVTVTFRPRFPAVQEGFHA